jgi:hypothetical protein
MHPYMSQALFAERVRDLHNQATHAHRRRLARQAAYGRRDRPRHGGGSGPPLSGNPPDTYEDFLLMTHAQPPREPSAAERARGQAVR